MTGVMALTDEQLLQRDGGSLSDVADTFEDIVKSGLAGAIYGAGAGAIVGSCVPGVGTLAGAIGGGYTGLGAGIVERIIGALFD